LVAAEEFGMRFVAWFQIIVGASIAALWLLLLLLGQVPEIDAGMRGIWFHLAAELTLAALLVSAGLSLLRKTRRGRLLAAMALGALGYSAVNSPGYYADSGDWGVVGMFIVIVFATVAAGTWLWRADVANRNLSSRLRHVGVRRSV
jgi:hypothetical protein